MKEGDASFPGGSEDLFLCAFKASPIGIALESLEGRPLFANPALCSMLGFSEEEMRTKHCVEFSPPEDAEKDWALFEQLRAGSIDHYHLEKRFCRRDGSLVWGRLSISLMGRGTSRLVVAMVEDLSEKMAAQSELSRSEAKVQRLEGRLIQAHEEERTRIARELHDDIHQQIVLVSIYLDQLRQDLSKSTDEIQQGINEAFNRLGRIAKDVHFLSHRLHSWKVEYLGLAAAAASFCRELSSLQEVEINFHCERIASELPKGTALCVYRVMQEALQNATKHSRSRHCEVTLSCGSGEIQLTVRDWGVGFDPAAAMKGPGLGLISMRERLKLLDGELVIESQPQQGTVIRARCPLGADKGPAL